MQVHIILGLGYFGSEAFNNPFISGVTVMADVCGCISKWLHLPEPLCHGGLHLWNMHGCKRIPMLGTQLQWMIIAFHQDINITITLCPSSLALYKHSDMFTTADKFGYNCIIKSELHINNCYRRCIIGIIYGILILCAVCTTCMIIGCCIHRLRKNHTRQILNPPVHLMCKLVLSMALPTLPYSYEKKWGSTQPTADIL